MSVDYLFLFCAIIGSVFVVLQFVALIFGLGAETSDFDGSNAGSFGDADGDGAPDEFVHNDGGFGFLKLFSIRAVTAFVAFFGLAGMACRMGKLNVPLSTMIALVCGTIAFVAVYYLLKALSSFNSDGSLRTEKAVGAEGVVYLTIPPKRSGAGKATIVQQERSLEYDAISDSDEPLSAGTPIIVVAVASPSLLLVAKK